MIATDTTARFWVGGDGSTRVYRKARAGVWGAANLDRPDTVRYDAATGGYVRELPHGVRVHFNAQGRHVRTVNRAGHATEFFYSSPRTDVRGTTTTFEFDETGLLSRSSTPMEAGKPAVVYSYLSAEWQRGLARRCHSHRSAGRR